MAYLEAVFCFPAFVVFGIMLLFTIPLFDADADVWLFYYTKYRLPLSFSIWVIVIWFYWQY
jgi:hypothetical protein